MKKALILLLSLVIFSPLAFADKNTDGEEVLKESKEALEATKEYSKDQVSEIGRSLESELTELDHEVQKMKSKASESTKETTKKTVSQLEKSLDQLKEKAKNLGNATKESWKDIRKSLSRTLDDVQKNFKSASND